VIAALTRTRRRSVAGAFGSSVPLRLIGELFVLLRDFVKLLTDHLARGEGRKFTRARLPCGIARRAWFPYPQNSIGFASVSPWDQSASIHATTAIITIRASFAAAAIPLARRRIAVNIMSDAGLQQDRLGAGEIIDAHQQGL
jgi:hypothetical protein